MSSPVNKLNPEQLQDAVETISKAIRVEVELRRMLADSAGPGFKDAADEDLQTGIEAMLLWEQIKPTNL